MQKIWIIIIVLFLIILFLFWKISSTQQINRHGEAMWKKRGNLLVYWQVAIYASAGMTLLIIYSLKWANLLSF